ncbi:MAG: bifunctional alpha,alpha-trehalose-phosphate synthase (UDP-forming)/trehalose-phosphatase [Thermoplasmatota archaeon]
MKRMILVSNRLPIVIEKKGNEYEYRPSIGGLATALASFYEEYESLWVGWPGLKTDECPAEEIEKIRNDLIKRRCIGIFLSSEDHRDYYEGFSNKTIWPLFHYFISETRMRNEDWNAYKRVNQAFAEEILKVAGDDDLIWIHDYHLFLLPRLIREKLPNATIGFFLHIPFPSSEVFRLLPWREEILNGIIGSDLIGFHTYDYVLHFISSVRRLIGHESSLGKIMVGPRTVKVGSFPISIDFEHYSSAPMSEEVQREKAELLKRAADRRVIMSIDRLDYTKGIPQRIRAYGRFLEKYPEYREKVTMIMVASPSRINVDTYKELKLEVEQLVGEVNGKYTRLGWVPIWYIHQNIPFEQLLALYTVSDIALITPLRDGMNLIAKEFIAAKSDHTGVLILSELAGAAKELGEALLVNPNNMEEIADAIFEALEMPRDKQIRSNRVMRERIRKYNVDKWASDFVTELEAFKKVQNVGKSKRMDRSLKRRMIDDYTRSGRRLIMLDYDGTLTPFKSLPEEAVPDEKLRDTLRRLTDDDRNDVIIVSGRDHETLENWFGGLDVNIVAEHGVWIRERKGDWKMIEPLEDSWKENIRPVLESYVIKTPGTFIEEKGYSLAWHYRRADQAQALAQISEMKETLHNMTSNLNVGILNGNKVIEIKNIGVNKGRGVKNWLDCQSWDFILAMGDDWTDEDMFSALDGKGYSIRIGYGRTRAKYNLKNVNEARELIRELIRDSD